jgi:GTP-binding protein
MSEYFAHRKSLQGAVLLMDIRHPLKEFDELMLEWCLSSNINTHILLTKADKLKKNQANKALFLVQNRVKDTNITVSLFSSLKKSGLDTLHMRLNEMFEFTNT